jgi:hypothetical protein
VCISKRAADIPKEPIAHACDPSYSGGRGQEDGGLKPAQTNSLRDPVSKEAITKKKKKSKKTIMNKSLCKEQSYPQFSCATAAHFGLEFDRQVLTKHS